MKVKLMNNGGFKFLDGVPFPAEVEACKHPSLDGAIHVASRELISIGATKNASMLNNWSFHDDEFEIIHE